MSREALVLLVCCCDFRDRAERLIPSKSLRNAVIRAFPGLFCILRMCAPRRAAAVVRPRGREKSADRRRRILISRLLIIRTSVPRRKSLFPAYFKGFPAVSPLIPPYPAFLKYPVSPQQDNAHFHSHCYIDQSFLAESSDLFLLKTFVHHTSYGCMVWFTNAIQANIRRETYTSQLMKGERCTIERPLFISSANFQLINICLHRIKKVRIHLHTLTSQQKIH